MPPNFQREGIDACKEIRKRHPGTGVVILSQYDDPDYAISLLSEGAAGYAYLLKDRIAEGRPAGPGHPGGRDGRLDARPGHRQRPGAAGAAARATCRPNDDSLLAMVAEGKPIKAIAAIRETTPSAVADDVERLFRTLAKGVSDGDDQALKPPAPPARGHRGARGAGRDAQPAAARRCGRTPRPWWARDRRDGAARGHHPHVRHPGLLDHRRAHRPGRTRGAAQPAPR